MTLLEIARRGARFAYRYGVEREMWIANLAKREKAVSSFMYTDDNGDPLLNLFSLERADFQYSDWSILADDDRQ